MKIRGNWGRLGNSSIGDWDYIGTINQSIVTVFGGAIVPGSTQVKLVNAGLVWETKETVNVGFDASFLNQRLTVSAEYYNSKPVTYWLRLRLPFLPVIKEALRGKCCQLAQQGLRVYIWLERPDFRL